MERRLLLLSGGVILLHTLVTILEEALFAQPVFREKAGSTFMTLTFYAVAAAAYAPRKCCCGGGSGSKKPRLSRRLSGMIAASAALYVTTTTLSKTALTYIDLPTQSILKSAKLLPVMVGSIVILGQRFTLREWLAAAMLVSGIAIFSASGSGQPRGAQSLRGGRRGVPPGRGPCRHVTPRHSPVALTGCARPPPAYRARRAARPGPCTAEHAARAWA